MRIFLSTFGTAGDVVPFTRLARGLLERGHAVTAHSWSMYRGLFPAGVDFVAAGHDGSAELAASLEEALRLPSPWLQIRRVARIFYGLGDGDAAARAYYARCREAMAGHTLAVCNVLDHVGQAAAELAGIPWVGWASRPPPPPDADRALAQEDQALGELLSAVTGGRRVVRTFRARAPLLDLIAGSPVLALPFPAEPTLTLTGSWLDRTPPAPLPAAVEDFLAAGPALPHRLRRAARRERPHRRAGGRGRSSRVAPHRPRPGRVAGDVAAAAGHARRPRAAAARGALAARRRGRLPRRLGHGPRGVPGRPSVARDAPPRRSVLLGQRARAAPGSGRSR
ncbi:MAG: hypothetical protein U1F43_30020 [Myxococcota bacterium]